MQHAIFVATQRSATFCDFDFVMSSSIVQFQKIDDEITTVSDKFDELKEEYEREIKIIQKMYKDKFQQLEKELQPIQDKFSGLDRTELIVNTLYGDNFSQEYILNAKYIYPKPNITLAEISNSYGRVPRKIE